MEIPQELRSEVGGMTPDEPDPDTNAQLWADKAPSGWKRCAGCGDEWGVEDDHRCECERDDDAEDELTK